MIIMYLLSYLKLLAPYICAVKLLIQMINLNAVKWLMDCLHNTFVCAVYIYYVYKHTHACIYLRKCLHLYIKYIYI